MSTIVNNTNGQLEVVANGRTRFYQFPELSNLAWTKNIDGFYVHFTYDSDYFVKLKLSEITNQPTWTDDVTGAEQAVKDISTWIGAGGAAIITALSNILTTLQNQTDYESKFVKDSNGDVFIEVRVWDQDSQTWTTTPVYYVPGSNTPATPVAPITYLDNSSILAQIASNTTGINLEATQLLVKGVLDAIKLDTANLDAALSTRATEATLVTVNNTLGFIFGQLQTIDNNISTRASESTLVVADQKLGYLTVDKTPTSIASTGVTNIPAFATEISIFNNGTGDAIVNGVKCPAGVTRTFGFKNPTSAIIVCDGLGTEELIIDYMA